MSDVMLRMRVWLDALYGAAENESGLEAVEYVAMVVAAVALIGAVMAVFQPDTTVGQAALRTFTSWITSLASGG